MFYRTRTYIAGDWDHDSDAVNQLYKWNDSKHWSFNRIHFPVKHFGKILKIIFSCIICAENYCISF